MSRKQYRGVMVFDFEVDGKFATVAKLEEAWDQFCIDMEAAVDSTVSDVKIEQTQAELQDRRGKTGPIKNIVFRGGRGENEKMSKSQMLRYEELWIKKWTRENLEYRKLLGADKKLFNKLQHMADKEGLTMDPGLGRLRNADSTMGYPNGSLNYNFRFQKKAWELAGEYNYDHTQDGRHEDIRRRIAAGDLLDIDDAMNFWELSAREFMPEDDAKRYHDYLEAKMAEGIKPYDPTPAIRRYESKAEKEARYERLLARKNDVMIESADPEDGKGSGRRGKRNLVVKKIKFPVGTFSFGGKGEKATFSPKNNKEFKNKIAHMDAKERSEFLNNLMKRMLSIEKSDWFTSQNVQQRELKASAKRLKAAIEKAKDDPDDRRFDEIWETMDFEAMQGQKAN